MVRIWATIVRVAVVYLGYLALISASMIAIVTASALL